MTKNRVRGHHSEKICSPGANNTEAELLQTSSAEETDRDTQIEGGRKYRRHMRDATHGS